MSPQDLVCARCWRDFFDTEAFESCCTGSPPDDGYDQRNITVSASASEIKDADCTWCNYIQSFIGESLMPEDRVTISLSPSQMKSCTPRGGNIFFLDTSYFSPTEEWKGGVALRLHAWTTANDNASAYVTARPVRTDVQSNAAICQLKKWQEECTGHEYCVDSLKDTPLPTRVIEVSPPGRRHPRLLESGSLQGMYATLSYCWGKVPFPNLTRSNYQQLSEGLDIATLPATICDAILTARNLSIPYLWIDALCIIQDSEEDKIREIAQMKNIYATSALTIVAASAKNVYEGFLHPRTHSEPSHTIPVRTRPGIFGYMSINELRAATYDERFEPLAKRAWTMQEQLLAKRTLTFTTHTMMWRCRDGTRNFGDSLYFPFDLDAGYNDNDHKYSLNLNSLLLKEEDAKAHRDKALSSWLRLVTAYSLRVASLESDKLNALAGIASHPSISHVLGPQYFAGMWQYKLARQLVWSTSYHHRTLPEGESFNFYRPVRYRAPSWSWASVEGGVIQCDFIFDDEDEDPPDVVCDIIECSTTSATPEINLFGTVLSAKLTIKSAVRTAWFIPCTFNVLLLSTWPYWNAGLSHAHEDKTITADEALRRHADDFVAKYPDENLAVEPEAAHGTDYRNMCGNYDESGDHGPVVVFCVAIILHRERDDGVQGLLLLPTEVEGGNRVFKRIGIFERGRIEDFQRETSEEICIV